MSVDSAISWLAETTLAVSLLIVCVLLARKIVARKFGAGAAYLLWLAPLARMLAPELKILPPPDKAPGVATTWIETAPSAFVAAEPTGGSIFNLPVAAVSIWAAGAILFLAWQFYKQRRFINAAAARSQAAPPNLIAEIEETAARFGLRKVPPVRMAADATGPLVAGVLQPLIVLPADFASRYSAVERRLALAHECAHISRGDLAATFAALLFRAAQWPNPLAHYAFSAFRADQESACDSAVIARNASAPDISYAYARAIVKSAANHLAPAASLAMSNHIKERLMLMKSGGKSSSTLGRAIAAAFIAGGLAATANYSYAAEKETKKEVKIVKADKKVSSVNVISVDDGEALEIEGVKNAKKIEIRNEDGNRTVKIWDRNGKLVSEDAYGPGEKTPYDTIVVVGADGKKKTIEIGIEPDHPHWIGEIEELEGLEGDDGDGVRRKHKVVVFSGDGDPSLDVQCDAIRVKKGDDGADEDVLCLGYADEKDPAARAAALKKTIAHREKALAKLRADLAEAEKEAKKK